jgi:signal peptidase II
MWVASGLLAGGAVGNLIDRVGAGHVTDFIELPPWPPFNVADVCITFGVVLLVLIYLREGIREERARKQGENGG